MKHIIKINYWLMLRLNRLVRFFQIKIGWRVWGWNQNRKLARWRRETGQHIGEKK
jgi:hypothetical protein